MVMSEEGLIEVSDGQRHTVIITIGTVENNILKQMQKGYLRNFLII